VFFRVACDPAL